MPRILLTIANSTNVTYDVSVSRADLANIHTACNTDPTVGYLLPWIVFCSAANLANYLEPHKLDRLAALAFTAATEGENILVLN